MFKIILQQDKEASIIEPNMWWWPILALGGLAISMPVILLFEEIFQRKRNKSNEYKNNLL